MRAAPAVACQLFPVFAPGVGGEGFPEVAGDQAPGQVVQRRGQHIGSAAALDHFAVMHHQHLIADEVRGENVFAVDWPEKEEALKYIHILKANEHETEVLTGCKNPREAALKLANWGVKEVLLTLGSMGSVIYADGEFHEIPAYPPTEIVDATGCGDTYMAGYLYMRNKGASYKEAGCFAAAMCTIKLEASGPFGGTEKDVWDIIERYK